MVLYEVRKEREILTRVFKVFALLVVGWALGYAHCWFALIS